MNIGAATEYVENFQTRFMRDLLSQAHASYWRHRAATFENARPKSSDYNGEATPGQLAERDRRLAGIAQACRNAADLALITAHDEPGDETGAAA